MSGEGIAFPAAIAASGRFFKGEALGNDYLVFEAGDAWPVTRAAVRAICDRHRGVGADGIIISVPPARAHYAVRIFNPDGSEAERSGNGLRIFAVAVVEGAVGIGRGAGAQAASEASGPEERRATGAPGGIRATAGSAAGTAGIGPPAFTVEVAGEVVALLLHGCSRDGAWDISVDMGRASFDDAVVRFERARLEADREVWALLEGGPGRGLSSRGVRCPSPPFLLCPVSLGNPHCVVLGARWDEERLRRLGPLLSTHPAFQRGTNVQLAWPVGKRRLRALVWERGAGETSASGSSACAVAAAAVKEGLVEAGPVDVEMPGGTLVVEVGPDFAITLRGPARAVCRGELSGGFLGALRPGSGPEKSD